MSPRDLSSRRIHEVQQALADYKPHLPGTDVELLGATCKAILASIDVRDLREVSTRRLVEQLEYVLQAIGVRASGEIVVRVRKEGELLIIESCLDDQPFLVSAMRALCNREGLEVRSSINAVARLRRNRKGELMSFGAGTSESIVRLEVRPKEEKDIAELEHQVRRRLAGAQAMVQDFEGMQAHLNDAADAYLAVAEGEEGKRAVRMRETEALLRWLCQENFVLFSVEDFGPDAARTLALGTTRVVPAKRDSTKLMERLDASGRLVVYERSTEESPIHRAGKPGHFMIRKVGPSGEHRGVLVVDGLFTYKALHTPPEEIPYLRVLLRDLLMDRDVRGDSHRGKSLTNAFNSLPIEYLLTEDAEHIWELTDRVLRAEEEGGSDVELRISDEGRSAFLFLTLPREHFSESLRLQVQDLVLRRLGASYADFGVYIDRYENAIVHFYVTGAHKLPVVNVELLREEVRSLAKGWKERLAEAIVELDRGAVVDDLLSIYEDAFTEEHRRRVDVERLARDISCLETLRDGQPLDCDLFISTTGEHPGSLNLRVFSRENIKLSDALPVIVHFGFDVTDSYTRDVRPRHMPIVDMDNFRLDVRRDRHRKVIGRRAEINRALRLVYAGLVGDDPLNKLVVETTMSARDVEVLRAYVAYLHQLKSPFAVSLIRQVLVDHPAVAQALIAHLASRFEPSGSVVKPDVAEQTLAAELRGVRDYTADRVLGALAEVIRATVRTNAFIIDLSAREAMAFKIAGEHVSLGPSPKPYREIWVYHADFEGVHLRGGKVARGGLRFSDRPDDFRTEIHGLMATQRVKNVLIVPMGAKGGFVLRNPPAGRQELRKAGDHYYGMFIRALLSVTDNVVEGAVASPTGIRHTEGDDPYLVVAADKGTAHLSDSANAISMEQGFWLDDAFASGGSNGYDHKATGITARGAWETTKRCFREIGLDPELDPITAIGVGDMSGDVFGNGLMRSRTIQLKAAFNHLHIFIDPTPDAERSFTERGRLFETPGSTWEDYDAAVLSRGGGVYARKSKEVPLSDQACELLGFEAGTTPSGDEVIRAIMRLEVHLFWMGGIGTYVKASSESHADVGDKGNDSVRIDARELRCKIFAEGANLSITDKGRVEFAKRGGGGYTAFLDNSGGVDTSDHEVNAKILYAPLLTSGEVSRDHRNTVMRSVEDEMCEMVLENNRSQSRMVSFDVRRSAVDPWRYVRTLDRLATTVPFDPAMFAMPDEEEIMARYRRQTGIFKCEAAVLCSHAKMLSYQNLLEDAPLPANVERALVRAYFPPRVVEDVGQEAIDGHLLRREIATTMLVNTVVDSFGATFLGEVGAATGRSDRDVMLACYQAASLGGVFELQRELYGLESKYNQEAIYAAMERIARSMERAVHRLLDANESTEAPEGFGRAGALLDLTPSLLSRRQRESHEKRVKEFELAGLPASVSQKIERLTFLGQIIEVIRMSPKIDVPAESLLGSCLDVAGRLGVTRLRQMMSNRPSQSPSDGPATEALLRQLDFHVAKLTQMSARGDVDELWRDYGLEEISSRLHGLIEREEVTLGSVVLLDSFLRRTLPAQRYD